MRDNHNVWDKILGTASIDDEPYPGLPLVEIAGDSRVLIEHHSGVTEYSMEKIRIKVKFGHICVCGSELVLARMIRGQLIISGKIESVHLDRRCR